MPLFKGCARQLIGDKVDENNDEDDQQRDGAAVLRVSGFVEGEEHRGQQIARIGHQQGEQRNLAHHGNHRQQIAGDDAALLNREENAGHARAPTARRR